MYLFITDKVDQCSGLEMDQQQLISSTTPSALIQGAYASCSPSPRDQAVLRKLLQIFETDGPAELSRMWRICSACGASKDSYSCGECGRILDKRGIDFVAEQEALPVTPWQEQQAPQPAEHQ
jgi:ribosomal protein S27AE